MKLFFHLPYTGACTMEKGVASKRRTAPNVFEVHARDEEKP